jgi:hypothetical protein
MKTFTDENKIKRNRQIGQITTISSLVILAVGLYMSFQGSSQLISYSFIALILGFILSQIGISYGNKWGRHPRPDESIDTALKGLDDKYTLFHYIAPVSHLLLGPSGICVLLPYSQSGTITYEKDRWRQKGGNFYLKLFAQDGLGRPDIDIASNTSDLKRFIDKKLPDIESPNIRSILVFTNEKATIQADEAPVPTLPVKKLKDYIRKTSKENPVSSDQLSAIAQLFQ